MPLKVLCVVCIGVSAYPLSYQAPSLKLANCPSPHFFRHSSHLYWFFVTPFLSKKSDPLVSSQSIKFFSSLIPSFLLKVTKFLLKISQLEFLVMTEKNTFGYKLFFVIKYFRFEFVFYVKIATLPPP